MLNEEELRDAALLVFANKQDQPGAKGAGEISEALRLGELKDRNWSIVACSAIDGRGVTEGMDWLAVSSNFNTLLIVMLIFYIVYRSVRDVRWIFGKQQRTRVFPNERRRNETVFWMFSNFPGNPTRRPAKITPRATALS